MEITNQIIKELKDEAGAAGDLIAVAICLRALDGDSEAIADCTEIIENAEAMADDGQEGQ